LFDLIQQSLGAFAVDNAEFSVRRSARLIGLIALAGAVIRTNRRSPVQFTLGARPQLQQFAAEVFHLRRVHENFGIRWPVAVGIFVGMPCSVAVGRAIASVPRDLLREYIEAFERQGWPRDGKDFVVCRLHTEVDPIGWTETGVT
jgi:hypothetical protein